MAKIQNYGIKYPFTNDNLDEVYIDLNTDYTNWVKSRVLHVLFTPKGQKLRDPDFGTNLIRFIFEPIDSVTLDEVKESIKDDINAYVPEVDFGDITINEDDNSENSRIIIAHYVIKSTGELNSVAVKI